MGAGEVLIGRQEELACLLELAGVTGTPPPGTRVALLAGEPGIGKTRLTRELIRRHTPDGLDLPFAPWSRGKRALTATASAA